MKHKNLYSGKGISKLKFSEINLDHFENNDYFIEQFIEESLGGLSPDGVADEFEVFWAKKKKAATARLEFFKGLALSHMKAHGIKQSKGELFQISRSLTPGALQIDGDFDVEKLPDGYYTVVPAVPEHKEPDKKALTDVLRSTIKDGKTLDQVTQIVEIVGLYGVRLVRNDSLRVK